MAFNNNKDVVTFTTYVTGEGELKTKFYHKDKLIREKSWDEEFFSCQEFFSILRRLRGEYEGK